MPINKCMGHGQFSEKEDRAANRPVAGLLVCPEEASACRSSQNDTAERMKRFIRAAFMGLSLDIVILAIYDMACSWAITPD
jgi:hypothetical protein